MSWLVCTNILLLLGIFPLAYTLSNDCPPSTCGHQNIYFPLNLETSTKSCRTAGLNVNLSCSSTNETILTLPSSESYTVVYLYSYFDLSVVVVVCLSHSISCPWLKGNLKLPNVNGSNFFFDSTHYAVVNCTTKQTWKTNSQWVVGPIPCLSGIGSFVYAIDADRIYSLPPSCIELYSVEFPNSIVESLEITPIQEAFVVLNQNLTNTTTCSNCISEGKICGYNIESDKIFCYFQNYNRGLNLHDKGTHLQVKDIIIGTTLMIFLIATLGILYYFKKYSNEKRKRIKVEQFLATYKSKTLTRYNFTSIKKITKKFKHKLGQGGFGSVYKGELNNGIHVAVKMLETSKSNGEDFINEVATIGKIHHVNVVRLMGFCSDGTNRALVYEFMPNESLEKFIFLGETKKKHELLSVEKLQEIAIGIAQGIDYLHQGCNHKIVHFDIKPHNILLDKDFNPKISDFGLAKLCSREQSIVTISAARGTMGYIAPEVYSRNFGPVSHKSDVYSYGMLLLEMIGRRKNVDPTVDNLSEIYFPEWIYNRLFHRTKLGLAMEIDGVEENMKKLATIALWCIQWNPTARPSMTKVVQMLTANFQSLEIPPKPFVPSSDQLGNVDVSTNQGEILEV